MSPSNILPHVYYSVSELSSVKDVRVLKNLNIKTIAYVRNGRAYEVDFMNETREEKDLSVKVDLDHVIGNVSELKPLILLGILYTLNQTPVVSVKHIKEFRGHTADLVTYRDQLLEIRKRNEFFEILENKF